MTISTMGSVVLDCSPGLEAEIDRAARSLGAPGESAVMVAMISSVEIVSVRSVDGPGGEPTFYTGLRLALGLPGEQHHVANNARIEPVLAAVPCACKLCRSIDSKERA